LKSIANLDITKSLLRDSNLFAIADLSKTYSSLGNEFSSSDGTDVEGMHVAVSGIE